MNLEILQIYGIFNSFFNVSFVDYDFSLISNRGFIFLRLWRNRKKNTFPGPNEEFNLNYWKDPNDIPSYDTSNIAVATM